MSNYLFLFIFLSFYCVSSFLHCSKICKSKELQKYVTKIFTKCDWKHLWIFKTNDSCSKQSFGYFFGFVFSWISRQTISFILSQWPLPMYLFNFFKTIFIFFNIRSTILFSSSSFFGCFLEQRKGVNNFWTGSSLIYLKKTVFRFFNFSSLGLFFLPLILFVELYQFLLINQNISKNFSFSLPLLLLGVRELLHTKFHIYYRFYFECFKLINIS